MENEKWYNSNFFTLIGQGFFIISFCLGVGTCGALLEGHIKIGEQPKEENINEKIRNISR
jgi:hypothetical protein